jgi:hypothetical protein
MNHPSLNDAQSDIGKRLIHFDGTNQSTPLDGLCGCEPFEEIRVGPVPTTLLSDPTTGIPVNCLQPGVAGTGHNAVSVSIQGLIGGVTSFTPNLKITISIGLKLETIST